MTIWWLELPLKFNPGHVAKEEYEFLDDDAAENQPFPSLKDVLESSDVCGVNVEIKYPLMHQVSPILSISLSS